MCCWAPLQRLLSKAVVPAGAPCGKAQRGPSIPVLPAGQPSPPVLCGDTPPRSTPRQALNSERPCQGINGGCSQSIAWAAWNRARVYKQPWVLGSWWAAKASGAAMPGSLLMLLRGDFLLPLTQILARWTRPCSPLAGLTAAGPRGIQE